MPLHSDEQYYTINDLRLVAEPVPLEECDHDWDSMTWVCKKCRMTKQYLFVQDSRVRDDHR